MSQSDKTPRVYGAADPANRQPKPEQGLRGERAARTSKPRQRRAVKGIEVEEQSGTAFAEGLGTTPQPARLEDQEMANARRRSRSGVFAVGALAAIGAAAGAWWARRIRGEASAGRDGPVAFERAQTDPDNFSHTRDAGPEHIRDDAAGRNWDVVDEASDESFPASDPPAAY